MDRRRCRKIQTLITPERTPEATTGFYVALSRAIEEVGTSGPMKTSSNAPIQAGYVNKKNSTF